MGSAKIRCIEKVVELKNDKDLDMETVFVCAKVPLTREKYQKRIERLFVFLGLEGRTTEEKSDV